MRAAGEFVQYLCVSAGMALAVSCFLVLDGLTRHVSGAAIAAAVVLAALACLVVAAAVAELASRYPAAPGIRTYLKQAFGDRAALALTFLYLLMLALIAGVEGVVLGRVLALAAPDTASAFVPGAILLAVLAMNVAGIELSRRVQTVATLLMIAGVVAIATIALTAGTPTPAPVPGDAGDLSPMGIATAVALCFFLFTGFEWVTPLGRSPQAYRRLIPMAMLGAVTALGIVYALFGLAIAHSGGGEGPAPHVVVARDAFGAAGVPLAITLSLLAVFTSFNAGILGASRLIYGIAREGRLPRWCAQLYLRTGAPVGALLLIGALAAVSMALVIAFELQLAAAAVAAAIVAVAYGTLLLAAARLRIAERPPAFACPIPSSLLYAGALCLLLLAGAALWSDPQRHMPLAMALLLISVVAAARGPGRHHLAAAR